MELFIYLIKRTDFAGYDNYSAAVVVAESEEAARLIRPDGNSWVDAANPENEVQWARSPDEVIVTFIGIVKNHDLNSGDIILASYNAG